MGIVLQNDELAEARRQLNSFNHRGELMQSGAMKMKMGTPCNIDYTETAIQNNKQSVAALGRKIARLERSNR